MKVVLDMRKRCFGCRVLLSVLSFLSCLTYAQSDLSFSGGAIYFELLNQDIEDALGCVNCKLIDYKSNANFKIKPQVLTANLQVRQIPSLANLSLEARFSYRDKNNDNKETLSPWLELSQLPQQVLAVGARVNRVSIEYRLRLSGFEKAGSHEITVIYSLGAVIERQTVFVTVPSVVFFKLDNQLLLNQADIDFDFRGLNVRAFLNAVESGEPILPTKADFEQLLVFTNDLKGVVISANLHDDSVRLADFSHQLLVFEQPVKLSHIVIKEFQDSFVPVLSSKDISLKLTGAEAWGSYRLILQFKAEIP